MKKILTLLLLSIATVQAGAVERTPAQMLTIAKQKLASVGVQSKARGRESQDVMCIQKQPTLSIYSNSAGYVVISRDDRFPAVLAYGVGRFDLNDLPDGTKWWFDAVQEVMQKSYMLPALTVAKVKAVSPMLTTKWGQWRPFNNFAPIFKKDNTKAPSGCVAIAMAQILNYNRYPASVEFEGNYAISDDEGKNSVSVSREYKWPYKDAYEYYYPEGASDYVKASYTPNQGNMVAYLCLDCGYAIDMTYNPSGSGAYVSHVPEALIGKFQYPANSVHYYYRPSYSEQEWMDIIYDELQKGFPIIYGGADANSKSGHAFVADGVDEDGLLHINWGWSGHLDGYYAFNLLNPGDEQFSETQEIVTGIRPEPMEGDIYGSTVFTPKPFEITYDNETKTLTFKDHGVVNICGKTIVGKLAVIFENLTNPEGTDYFFYMSDNPEDMGEETLQEDDYTLLPSYGWGEYEGSFEWELKEGQYKVYFASKDIRESEWQIGRTYGGPFYCEMTVDAEGKVVIGEAPVYTGISTILYDRARSPGSNSIYDLNGRFMGTDANALRKGIYIIDGKKMVK